MKKTTTPEKTTRAYLDGELTRPQTEAFIKAANYAIVKTAIPAMEDEKAR